MTSEGAATIRSDWTHLRESMRLLYLAVAQIDIALRESDQSVEQLTTSFTHMMEQEQAIADAIDHLPDLPEIQSLREDIRRRAALVSDDMQAAIVAFQFYDRLSQRLTHVGESLEAMAMLVDDPNRLNRRTAWQELQQQIRSKYSMREERELFDRIMQDDDLREALRRYHEAQTPDSADDIEFF